MRRSVSVRLLTLLAVIVLLALVMPAGLSRTVRAEISLGCRFWGPVTVCGARVGLDTEVTVRILDPDTGPSWLATMYLDGGVPHYRVDIPPEDFPEPGGVEGDTVYFIVTGVDYEGNTFTANLQGPDATWRRACSLRHPLRVGTPGDANLDGVIDMGDVIKVQRIMQGLANATPCADANQDGVIDIGDIIKIRRIIAGSP